MKDPVSPVVLPVDGVLDLHAFSPKDVKDLVPEYIEECLRRGILDLRIIHGKGTGRLRQAVREALKGHAYVKSFEEGGNTEGGEGVTVAKLNAG